jgi:hypothetical protein
VRLLRHSFANQELKHLSTDIKVDLREDDVIFGDDEINRALSISTSNPNEFPEMVTIESNLDELVQIDPYAAFTIHFLAKRVDQVEDDVSLSKRYNLGVGVNTDTLNTSINMGDKICLKPLNNSEVLN